MDMPQNGAFGPGARFLIVAGAAVVVLAGLRAASAAILPIVLAVFLAIVSLPLLERVRRLPLPAGWRLPQAVAVLLTVAAGLATVLAVGFVLSASVEDFARALPRYQARLEQLTEQPLAWLEQHGYPVTGDELPGLVSPAAVFDLFRGTFATLTRGLTFVLLVLLTLVFALLEGPRLPRKLHVAFGSSMRAEERLSKVAREIQTYLRVKTLISLATGLLFGLWLWGVGVDFPVLWGFLAFVLNYIPNLGSILAALPPILLGLAQLGWGGAFAVLVGNVVVNQVLSNVVEPHLMGRSLGLSPVVVVVSLVVWGWVWGGVGVILAVPTTMTLKILMENSEDLRWLAVLLESNPQPRSGEPA
jgi:AI-2 transport protein TqsA